MIPTEYLILVLIALVLTVWVALYLFPKTRPFAKWFATASAAFVFGLLAFVHSPKKRLSVLDLKIKQSKQLTGILEAQKRVAQKRSAAEVDARKAKAFREQANRLHRKSERLRAKREEMIEDTTELHVLADLDSRATRG